MFAKVLACLMTFLVWLFPFLKPQINSLSAEIVAKNLMQAIATKDTDLFTDQLCHNIKQTVEDLPGKINELFDAIDGELVDFTWTTMGGYLERRNNGRIIQQNILTIDFTTTEGSYRLSGTLEFYNSFQPKEMGMRQITLRDDPTALEWVVQIRAEIVGGWHE